MKAWGSYYEDLDFWKELNIKYPVTSTLYTGVGNTSVHELARIYFRALSLPGRELMDLANGKGMESPVALEVMRKTGVYIKSFEVAKLSAELT